LSIRRQDGPPRPLHLLLAGNVDRFPAIPAQPLGRPDDDHGPGVGPDRPHRARRGGGGDRRLRHQPLPHPEVAQDDPLRGQAGPEGLRRRPGAEDASPPPGLGDIPKPDDQRRWPGRRGGHQPDAHRHRPPLRPQRAGSAGGGAGCRGAGGADQGRGPPARSLRDREQAARPGALPLLQGGPVHPIQLVRGRRRRVGDRLPPQGVGGMRLTRATVPAFLIAAVLMMVVPVSPVVLDLLLAANLALAVLILLGTILLKDSLDFSVFPSLLLIPALLRLALNVSSTRLILLDGYAGKVIETFGNFVIGGSVVVGLVVFFILVIIQFVVITNGASRVAEVGARFTLDAMPGKQMAIDADLTAGLINEEQARELRARIAKEADFYGAMDGASKFVKGDAIAGLIITAINLFGGLAVGVGMQGLPLDEAIQTYSLLSVGDGLVSQLPALLISLSTGLLVTRVRSEEDLGGELADQLFNRPKSMRISSYVVAGLAFLPGLPTLSFLGIAGVLFAASGRRKREEKQAAAAAAAEPVVTVAPDSPEALLPGMRVEPLELHLAFDILDLIDTDRGGDLLDRVRALRSQIAQELGFVMPYVRTRDDVTLPPSTYRILLRGVEVARGTVPPERLLAIPTGDNAEIAALGGEETTEPVFGLTAYWLPVSARPAAIAAGATV